MGLRTALAIALVAGSTVTAQAQDSDSFFPQFLQPSGGITGNSFGIPGINDTYDYVIVGGGLAGSVVAARLAQKTNASIAVVEAGSFPEMSNGNFSQVPYYSTQYVGGQPDDWQPLIDWGLVTVPQVGAAGRRIHYAQGKCIGGSSARNQMLYHRATVGTYQRWADEVGDDAFTFENMLPYFKRSTSFTAPNVIDRFANATANYSLAAYDFPTGPHQPLQISFPNYAEPLHTYGPAAFAAAGVPPAVDFVSGSLNGYGYTPYTIDQRTGTRSSAETSFLTPAMRQGRVKVYQSSQAMRVLFDGQRRATGVLVSQPGLKPYALSARKQVVVSAGVFHSPQLLMLSGVGPRATLDANNISVVSALEGVGQEMWDTTAISGPTFHINVPTTDYFEYNATVKNAVIEQYLRNATGPLTSESGGFWAWEKLPAQYRKNFSNATEAALAKFPADWPELEMVFSASPNGGFVPPSATKAGFVGSISGLLVSTVSRGNVTISSNSIADPPVINTRWLAEKPDQEVAVASYRRMRDIWTHVGTRYGAEVTPGANVTSDADLLKYIQESGVKPIHHGSSTCKMGKPGDNMTVVDSHARVQGVTGLRVIDSSSFRFTTPGHTQGTTYGHAERLVQTLIDDTM